MTKPSVFTPGTELLARYWSESSRPLVSLAFVAPMLVTYEVGLLLLGGPAIRSGVDVWLRRFLNFAGLEQYFLLPILTCGILLAWHHVKGEPWKVGWLVLYGMFLECILLGAGLLVIGHWQNAVLGSPASQWTLAASVETGKAVTWVAYFGAGIYEELLFRLMLLPALAAMLRSFGLARSTSLVSAVIAGSLLFAVAHYRFEIAVGTFQLVNSIGDPFEWITFSFRCMAGVIFSLLFIYRGFGVAAGAHALYDILLAGW
jgi:membrane protease YdiL (CAAX protease family)